jgi:hypothetical protein
MNNQEVYAQEIARYAKTLGISVYEFPTEELPPEGHFVSLAKNALQYGYTERGTDRCTNPKDVDELLFLVAKDVTWKLASDWELKNRIKGEDSRKQLFSRHVELMTSLNKDWKAAMDSQYEEILSRHPFDDVLAKRAACWTELIAKGVGRDDAVRRAEELFPYETK